MSVVYLDIDDEITSAVARLRTSDDLRVLLVLPPGSRIATSRINFRLLAREALEHGRKVAIATNEAGVRQIAASAGLQAYASVAEYEAATTRPDRPPEDEPEAETQVLPGSRAGTPLEPEEPPSGREGRVAIPASSTWSTWQPAIGVRGADGPRTGGEPTGAREVRRRGVEVGSAAPAHRRRGRWLALLLVLAIAGALAGVGAFLLLPSATIAVTPRSEPLGPVRLSLVADPRIGRADPEKGIVPAERIEIPLRARGTFKATGVEVSETTARGTVRFQSENTVFDVAVPSGTRVSTASGIELATTVRVVVPKASFAAGRTTREAPVRAVAAGAGGNVAPGAITRLPASLRESLITVTNPAATSGGSRTETRLVTRNDYDAAVQALTRELPEELAAALEDPETVPGNLVLHPATASRGRVSAEPGASVLVGQRTDEFNLVVTAEGSVTAVDEGQLMPLILARLRDAVPESYQLFEDSISTAAKRPQVEGRTVRYAAEGSGEIWRPLDEAALREQVRGRTVPEARQILERYGSVVIETWPEYVGSITTLDPRLSLTIAPPERLSR